MRIHTDRTESYQCPSVLICGLYFGFAAPLWLIVFQLFLHPLQKIFDRFIDSSLQPGADAGFAHQSDSWVEFPRTLASKFNLLRDVDAGPAVLLLKFQ